MTKQPSCHFTFYLAFNTKFFQFFFNIRALLYYFDQPYGVTAQRLRNADLIISVLIPVRPALLVKKIINGISHSITMILCTCTNHSTGHVLRNILIPDFCLEVNGRHIFNLFQINKCSGLHCWIKKCRIIRQWGNRFLYRFTLSIAFSI